MNPQQLREVIDKEGKQVNLVKTRIRIRKGNDSGGTSYVYSAWNLETVDRQPDINLGRFNTKAEALRDRKRYPRDNRGYYIEDEEAK